ncbi:MAG: hypothetical protein HY834_08860 [Devosia nanyangense]|uniref:Uncharacterized protein n=1 Tax=Devosia nanyangense TaxID=1228055 RepID=A0A933NYA0_9HYPH|nr:hypothetical protein [Devosia nanyangense]
MTDADPDPLWARLVVALLNVLSGRAFDAGREYERKLWEIKAKAAEKTVEQAARETGALSEAEIKEDLNRWRIP